VRDPLVAASIQHNTLIDMMTLAGIGAGRARAAPATARVSW
jgi:hypothetical protein